MKNAIHCKVLIQYNNTLKKTLNGKNLEGLILQVYKVCLEKEII